MQGNKIDFVLMNIDELFGSLSYKKRETFLTINQLKWRFDP